MTAAASTDIALDEAYATLGLTPGCSNRELQARFRALAKQLHPDLNSDPSAGETFRRLEQDYRLIAAHRQRQGARDRAQAGSEADPAATRAARVEHAVDRIARLLPDATPTPLTGIATAWRFRISAGPLVEEAMLVHDATDDAYGLASIATSIDGQPIAVPDAHWTRPTRTGFLPLTADGRHHNPEVLTDRLTHWLARVAWIDHRLGPDPWDPQTDLTDWAASQLAWILPLLGVSLTDDVDQLVDDELEGLRSLAERTANPDADAVRAYLYQMVNWLLARHEASFR